MHVNAYALRPFGCLGNAGAMSRARKLAGRLPVLLVAAVDAMRAQNPSTETDLKLLMENPCIE